MHGKTGVHRTISEDISRLNARRSIVLNKNVNAGSVITEKNLTSKRPAFGISPLHWDEVIGLKARHNMGKDHILKWSDLE